MSLNSIQDYTEIDPDPYQRGYAHVVPFIQTRTAARSVNSAEFLGAADIEAFVQMQERIRPGLEQPYHLKERTPQDIQAHLAERMPLIGARAYTEELKPLSVVAGCLLSFLKNHDDENTAIRNVKGYPVAKGQYPVTAIVQSLCVDPDPAFVRQGLSQMVLEAARYSAQQNGMTQIISAVADDNIPSCRAFEKAGYKVFDKGFDPVQGYPKSFYRLCIG